MKNNSFFKPEIPPASLNLDLGSSLKNHQKSHGWIDRHLGWLAIIMFVVICMIVWWVDCKINPEAHSQSFSQGLHQLFH